MEESPSTLSPSAAALSRPILMLLIFSFVLNAGSGIGLWLRPTHGWRVFHGWTIPLFLIVFGVIWRVHVVRGWRLKKNVSSGLLTLGIFLALIITGWAVYYPPAGSEAAQQYAKDWHTWLGLVSSFLLLAHSFLGWKGRESNEAR